jgi:hypothetical protein
MNGGEHNRCSHQSQIVISRLIIISQLPTPRSIAIYNVQQQISCYPTFQSIPSNWREPLSDEWKEERKSTYSSRFWRAKVISHSELRFLLLRKLSVSLEPGRSVISWLIKIRSSCSTWIQSTEKFELCLSPFLKFLTFLFEALLVQCEDWQRRNWPPAVMILPQGSKGIKGLCTVKAIFKWKYI